MARALTRHRPALDGAPVIAFTVPGRAQPGGSKRAFVRNGHAQIVDANPNAGAWKERVALQAAPLMQERDLLDEPLHLCVTIYFVRPRTHYNTLGELNKKGRETPYPIGPPDATKLVRAIEDALQGIVYVNDSRICEQHITKRWGQRDEVHISIMPLTTTEPHERRDDQEARAQA
jgi:Holliday junction resolvase RusA-like endonuclease